MELWLTIVCGLTLFRTLFKTLLGHVEKAPTRDDWAIQVGLAWTVSVPPSLWFVLKHFGWLS